MKLVMKADDGKEIVYLSANDYDAGYVEESPDTLIIDVSRINPKYKEYFENIIKEKEKEKEKLVLKITGKNKECLLITPEIYFVFSEELYSILSEQLTIKERFFLAIGCIIKIDGEDKWVSFFNREMKKNAN